MTPVIRISDQVFRKLQELSEPLIDTPNSVMERVIDWYRANHRGVEKNNSPKSRAKTYDTPPDGENVFLAPASTENVKATIEQSVSLKKLRTLVSARVVDAVSQVLDGREDFHCWAMTKSSRGTYDYMQVGDVVLISVKNSGTFSFIGRVTGKLENEELGKALWPVQTGHPWSLIYFLDQVQSLHVSKERLVSELGYNRSYRVYGIIRVNPQRVESAIARHGSLERLLLATSIDR